MKALITGASSGLGEQFALRLSDMGCDIIITARREDKLEQLAKKIKTNVTVIKADLSKEEEVISLYNQVKDQNIDILINNAGFGMCGYFDSYPDTTDKEMINVNITALCLLTKLFYRDFLKNDKGYILNVASVAGFMPGPLMAQYYATKAYVLNFTRALYKEAKMKKSNVHFSVLCPGPVDTEFNKCAKVKFALPGAKSDRVVKYALAKMFKRKLTILPQTRIKLAVLGMSFMPSKIIMAVTSRVQKSKIVKGT